MNRLNTLFLLSPVQQSPFQFDQESQRDNDLKGLLKYHS